MHARPAGSESSVLGPHHMLGSKQGTASNVGEGDHKRDVSMCLILKRDQLAQQFMLNNTCHILLIPSDAMQRGKNHCMAVPGISSFTKAIFPRSLL